MNQNDFPAKNKLDTKQTAANGVDWTTFDAEACTYVILHNATAVAIEFRLGGAGDSVQVPANTLCRIDGVRNANQVSMRRVDLNVAQVTVGLQVLD